MSEMHNWNSVNSTTTLNRGTIWGRPSESRKLKVDEVEDVHDFGDLGTKIFFKNKTVLELSQDEALPVIQDLKNQIRNRPHWCDRSEHWEGYEWVPGAYVNAPHLEARLYSFRKEMAILNSRMTRQEREELDG